jgi:hypothetical protein
MGQKEKGNTERILIEAIAYHSSRPWDWSGTAQLVTEQTTAAFCVQSVGSLRRLGLWY